MFILTESITNGTVTMSTEVFLVDADSFTGAKNIIYSRLPSIQIIKDTEKEFIYRNHSVVGVLKNKSITIIK